MLASRRLAASIPWHRRESGKYLHLFSPSVGREAVPVAWRPDLVAEITGASPTSSNDGGGEDGRSKPPSSNDGGGGDGRIKLSGRSKLAATGLLRHSRSRWTPSTTSSTWVRRRPPRLKPIPHGLICIASPRRTGTVPESNPAPRLSASWVTAWLGG